MIIVDIPCFGRQLIEWGHLENSQITRVTRLRGILAELGYFLRVLSIYHQFIIILTPGILLLWL